MNTYTGPGTNRCSRERATSAKKGKGKERWWRRVVATVWYGWEEGHRCGVSNGSKRREEKLSLLSGERGQVYSKQRCGWSDKLGGLAPKQGMLRFLSARRGS